MYPSSRLQRHGLETKYGLLECPPNLSVSLRLSFVFYHLQSFNYFFIYMQIAIASKQFLNFTISYKFELNFNFMQIRCDPQHLSQNTTEYSKA